MKDVLTVEAISGGHGSWRWAIMRAVRVLCVAGLALSCSGAGLKGRAVDGTGTDETTATSRTSVVVARGLPGESASTIDDILLSVIRVRGLEPIGPVSARGVTHEQQVAYVKAETRKPENIRPLMITEGLLKATGSLPGTADLIGIVGSFMIDDVAGYYDWDRKVLFVGDWVELEAVAAVLAHELTHTLQDQHFGLAGIIDPVDGMSEPGVAGLAVAEGDATVTMAIVSGGGGMSQFNIRMVNALADMMDDSWDNEASKVGEVPAVVSEMLKFPYVAGLRYVGWLLGREGGGWPLVDAALKAPPLSTEQIIHFDGPGGTDVPIEVRLPPDAVGDGAFSGSDIVGESGFQAIFRDVMPRAGADAAAAGWGGDRFGVWSMPDGSTVVALASVWDSPKDATEAGMALSRLRRPPDGLVVQGVRVVAAWGRGTGGALDLAGKLARNLESARVTSRDEWRKEIRHETGGDAGQPSEGQ